MTTLSASRYQTAIRLLRITVFCLLAGRAWQHLFWDAPYRTFLWSQEYLSWFVEGWLGMTWQEYATSPRTDAVIQGMIRATGVWYALVAVLSLAAPTSQRWRKPVSVVLWLTSGMLFLLGMLYMKEKHFQWGQLFEYSAQFGAPALLAWFLYRPVPERRALLAIKILVALTFLCHGLYAYGYYPRPGGFVDMVINILGVEENTAHKFLVMAGVLDFVVIVLVFIPDTAKVALWYMVVWGTLTSLARVVAHIDFRFFASTLDQWWWETVMRAPHALLPLLAAYLQFGWPRLRRKAPVKEAQAAGQ